jgi:lysophospholipase L1-like esterase
MPTAFKEADKNMQYILCVGDSLTYGARDEYHRSYPAELSRLFWEREEKPVFCVNHGISGETSSQLLHRVYQNSQSCPQAQVALVLIGTNDTFVSQPSDIYQDNLRQIVQLLSEDRRHIGLGLLPPLIGPGLLSYPKDGQEQLEAFNEIISRTASQYGCFLADFTGMDEYIIDTAHFSHAGYVKMAEIWYSLMKEEGVSL